MKYIRFREVIVATAKTRTLTARVPEGVDAACGAFALIRGTTKSALMAEALEEFATNKFTVQMIDDAIKAENEEHERRLKDLEKLRSSPYVATASQDSDDR